MDATDERRWGASLPIDVALYACLFWRDYQVPGQLLVAHYVSFLAITDLAALFAPAARRPWFQLFRLSGGLSFLVLVCALAAKGLEGQSATLTAATLGLIALRIAHATWALRAQGPRFEELKALFAEAKRRYTSGSGSERLAFGYLGVAVLMFYFPQVAYWTHFPAGEARLDDILTGFQAQQGLNVALKLLVFELLVVPAGLKFAMRSTVAGLFVLQWPMMPSMFYLAPIPVAHIGLELFEVALAVAAFRHWRAATASSR